MLARLRDLADRSATVVFTTHSIEDLAACDRVVFMARGGRVAFVGTLADALEQFDARSVPELYRRLAVLDGNVTNASAARAASRHPTSVREMRSGDQWRARSRSGAC